MIKTLIFLLLRNQNSSFLLFAQVTSFIQLSINKNVQCENIYYSGLFSFLFIKKIICQRKKEINKSLQSLIIYRF